MNRNHQMELETDMTMFAHPREPVLLATNHGKVAFYNQHLISPQLLQCLGKCFRLPVFQDMDHGIFSVVLHDRAIKAPNGDDVYAIFVPDTCSVALSLPYIFQGAIEAVMADCRQISLVLMLHFHLMYHFLHEIHHARSWAAGIDIFDPEVNHKEEAAAKEWGPDMIPELVKRFSVEPGNVGDEPFFWPHVEAFLSGGDESLVRLQKELLQKNILVRDVREGEDDLNIYTFRRFVRIISDDDDGWGPEFVEEGGEDLDPVFAGGQFGPISNCNLLF